MFAWSRGKDILLGLGIRCITTCPKGERNREHVRFPRDCTAARQDGVGVHIIYKRVDDNQSQSSDGVVRRLLGSSRRSPIPGAILPRAEVVTTPRGIPYWSKGRKSLVLVISTCAGLICSFMSKDLGSRKRPSVQWHEDGREHYQHRRCFGNQPYAAGKTQSYLRLCLLGPADLEVRSGYSNVHTIRAYPNFRVRVNVS